MASPLSSRIPDLGLTNCLPPQRRGSSKIFERLVRYKKKTAVLSKRGIEKSSKRWEEVVNNCEEYTADEFVLRLEIFEDTEHFT